MKKLAVIILICHSLSCFSQFERLLRTDGVYIFDNGSDSIIPASGFARVLAEQYNTSHKIETLPNPCGQVNLVTMDGSIYISMLSFYSLDRGRRSNLGACRSERHIRDNAMLSLHREVTMDTTALAINQQLHDIVFLEDSTLSFLYSYDPYLQERYTGKAFGDTLLLEVRRTVRPESVLYNGNRLYRFFPYTEIFDCNFNYNKP